MDLNLALKHKNAIVNRLSLISNPQLIEEAFSEALMKIKDLELQEESGYALTYTVTKNELLNLIRTESNYERTKKSWAAEPPSQPDTEYYDRLSFVRLHINLLPRTQKEAIKARLNGDEYGYRIAKALGINAETFKANCRHAILKLRHVAKGYSDETGTSSIVITNPIRWMQYK